MRFFFGQMFVALGVGVVMALIRYYTMFFTLKWIRGRLQVLRKARNANLPRSDRR